MLWRNERRKDFIVKQAFEKCCIIRGRPLFPFRSIELNMSFSLRSKVSKLHRRALGPGSAVWMPSYSHCLNNPRPFKCSQYMGTLTHIGDSSPVSSRTENYIHVFSTSVLFACRLLLWSMSHQNRLLPASQRQSRMSQFHQPLGIVCI